MADETDANSETAPESPGTPADPGPLGLRNRLLATLLTRAPESFALTRLDDRSALLAVADLRAPLLLLTADALADVSRLGALFAAHPGPLFVVVCGAGSDLTARLRDVLREQGDVRSVALYVLGDDLKLKHVEGRRLPRLAQVATGLPQQPPLSPEALEQLLTSAHAAEVEVARYSTGLRKGVPWASAVIGATCILVFYAGQKSADGAMAEALLLAGGNTGEGLRAGELWRLMASMFLHGSDMHLLVNMMSLYFVGSYLERMVGRTRFVLLYAVSGLVGALASSVLGAGLSVGASGAIWGLMTAGYGLASRPVGVMPQLMARRLRGLLTMPLLANIGISFLPRIDWRAHFGGGFAGLVLGLLALFGRDPEGGVHLREPGPVVRAAAVLMGLLMGGSLLMAVWQASRMAAELAVPTVL